MGKELEALECLEWISSELKIYYEHLYIVLRDSKKELISNMKKANEYLDTIKQALLRLEAIDNANPSEALKYLDKIKTRFRDTCLGMYLEDTKEFTIIKQALLKAEKEHNSVNLLMQELDCKDFAELRKYARCGYEKINKKDLHLERVE